MNDLPIELLQHIVSYLLPNQNQTSPQPQKRKGYPTHTVPAILIVRLVSQALAAAASRPFVTIIQSRTWTLNTSSLTRLANLLLNVHVAKHFSRLVLNTYLFALDRDYTLETRDSLDRAVAARKAYLAGDKVVKQLSKVFVRARALREIIILPTMFEQPGKDGEVYPPPKLEADDGIQARIPNPLVPVRNALCATRVSQRLSAVWISNPEPDSTGNMNMDISCGVPSNLVCLNVTRLSLDAVYVIRSRVPLMLECAKLRVLELLHVERLTARDLEFQADHGPGIEDASDEAWLALSAKYQRQRVRAMLESVTCIRFVACAEYRGDTTTQASVVSAAILEGLVGYLARHVSSLEVLEIRNMVVEGKMGNLDVNLNGLVEKKELSIGTMRLLNTQWESVLGAWASPWQSGEEHEGVVALALLRCTVSEILD